MQRKRPLLVFYGDDFTGSMDVVLQYRRLGLEGVIFLGLPSAEQLQEAAAEYPVVGIAGVTRALPSAEVSAVIEPAFRRLVRMEPDLLQYKVCSTADSSPSVGSFAPAIRLGRQMTGERPVPVLVAQPGLGRYTVFSNHFAVYRNVVYRLDRQPVMANHPVTPMREADLRVHLQRQLDEPVGAVTVDDLHRPGGGAERLAAARRDGLGAVIVDALTEADLEEAGHAVLAAAGDGPAFAVGSGGLSTGIAMALGYERRPEASPVLPSEGPCLAVSGSCSPVTSDQIRYALAQGWHGVRLDLAGEQGELREAVEQATAEALRRLESGRSVVVYTCADDRQVRGAPIPVGTVASALAAVVQSCAELPTLTRVLIAGGDTSGHVVTELGATAITSKSALGGTLLAELQSILPAVDGLEVVLKGGQIGTVSFFEQVRLGEGAP